MIYLYHFTFFVSNFGKEVSAMGRVISITNQKGGVGKTVTSECLGVILANQDKKVLLVDFDPQGNLTKGLDIEIAININIQLKMCC